jgi:hypothetical protein
MAYLVAAMTEGKAMSKNQDRKKETRKKPTRTLEEKRAAKRAKREGKPTLPM